MNQQQINPTEKLDQYVRYFGLMEHVGAYNNIKTFKIIADGCPGLFFQENADSFYDSQKQTLPNLFIHGLASKHSEKTTKGNFSNIGIYFKPYAIKSIFGIDASELTDQYIDLSLLIGNQITEQLLNTQDNLKRIEILTNFIVSMLDKNQKRKDKQAINAINFLGHSTSETSLRDLRSKMNISERSLERIFKRHVGIPPKRFSRIIRFQSAIDDLRKQSYQSLTHIAYQNHYADQAHCIRDFIEFAGVNPSTYLKQAIELTGNFPEWKS